MPDGDESAADRLAHFAALCKVIASWDLEDDAGVIPLTPDALSRVPEHIIVTVCLDVAKKIRRIKSAQDTPRPPHARYYPA